MANPWFRMYAEFATDAKVQMMPEEMQRRYIMLMCLRCSNSLVTLHHEEIAFQLRITSEELEETKRLFVAKGFIDSDWNLLNWEKRQFSSDASTSRVAKYRALQKQKREASCNGNETLQKRKSNAIDTDTDTDTDTDKKNKNKSSLTPDGVSDSVWQDFKKLRKAKKAAITDTAMAGIQREADKAGMTLQQALVMCCERGWAGFKAVWVTTEQTKTTAETAYQRSMRERFEEASGRKQSNIIDITPQRMEALL